jgi:hypothetical protein
LFSFQGNGGEHRMGENLPVTIILLAIIVAVVGITGAWSFGAIGGVADGIIGFAIAAGLLALIRPPSSSDDQPFDPA